MTDLTVSLISATMPTLTVLVGILVNNSRLSDLNTRLTDLQKHMDQRFEAMEKLFTEKLLRVEQVMDARIKHLEDQ